MQLKQISRIVVSFSPWNGQARSAREFLARVTSAPARASNPACEVETQLQLEGEPFVEVQYENKQTERFLTAQLTVAQLLREVQSRSEEMDTQQKLKAAGVAGQRLESGWTARAPRSQAVGAVGRIPRQQ